MSLEQRLVLDLEFLPVQHRVLGLFASRSDQVELVGDGVSFLDLLGGPLGGTAGGGNTKEGARDRQRLKTRSKNVKDASRLTPSKRPCQC